VKIVIIKLYRNLLSSKGKGKGKVVLVLFFNWAPRHEGVLGSGVIAPRILEDKTQKQVYTRHNLPIMCSLHAAPENNTQKRISVGRIT